MKKIIAILIILGFIALGILVFILYKKAFSSVVKKETTFFIQSTDDYTSVYNKLKGKQLVKDEFVFEILANKLNLKNKIISGKYIFSKGTNTIGLIRKLRNGNQTAVKLVINNINFKKDLAGKISTQLDIDSLEFLDFLNDESKLKKLGYNKDNIMCLFISNTYQIYWSVGLKGFIKRMQKEHNTFWNNSRTEKSKSLGLTTDEVFILASIVEKEYKYADERKRIAGVYLNRLRKPMPLQADPTCKFAWGDLSIKRVLFKHTRHKHPYNTYYISGLPPGPICLPETSTIDAVLNAEEHSYYYFCAHYNLDGRHDFNKTLSEHNKAARKYQKALNKLKIF